MTLTAITCVYNMAGTLEKAIQSVMLQSCPPDEYVIVDDGSTDGSADIARGYSMRHGFIKVVTTPVNRGFFPSLCPAFKACTSDYVYLGPAADDFLFKNFFHSAMRMAARYPRAGVILGKTVVGDAEGRTVEEQPWPTGDFSGYLDPASYLQTVCSATPLGFSSGAAIFRRDALNAVGGVHSELGNVFDVFAIAATALEFGACFIPEVSYSWLRNPNGMSFLQLRNPWRALDLVARSAWLMRSPGFRDLFPEAYVARYERESREILIRDNVTSLKNRLENRLDPIVAGFYRKGGVMRRVSCVLDAAQKCYIERTVRRAADSFTHYRPDLSCFKKTT